MKEEVVTAYDIYQQMSTEQKEVFIEKVIEAICKKIDLKK